MAWQSDAAELLRELANADGAVGLQLTIFDPHLDPDGSSARTLVSLLEQSLTTATDGIRSTDGPKRFRFAARDIHALA